MIGKFMLLGASVLSFIAVFLPLVSGSSPAGEVSLSTLNLLVGSTAVGGVSIDMIADKGQMLTIGLVLSAPFLFYALFTGIAFKRRFGRGLAIATLVMGLLATGLMGLFSGAFEEGASKNPNLAVGFGMTLLLVGSVLALVAGIVGTAKPERAEEPAAPAS